jgi:hypothetical protein
MTSVTIGPGAMIKTTVIRRKAVKSSTFMSHSLRLGILNPKGRYASSDGFDILRKLDSADTAESCGWRQAALANAASFR